MKFKITGLKQTIIKKIIKRKDEKLLKRNRWILILFIVIIAISLTTFLISPQKNTGKTTQPTTKSKPTANKQEYLLPDLQVRFPHQLYIQINPETGNRELRFSTTTENLGDGPLILKGETTENQTIVYQVLTKTKGKEEQVEVGSFIRHAEHDHWHFEDFAELELIQVEKNNSLEQQVATTGKITSCIHDLNRLPSPPADSPENGPYSECGRETQGLSVGWSDTYYAYLAGQSLNLENIPDGRYLLRLTVNPSNLIKETNEDNNKAEKQVEISGMDIQVTNSSNKLNRF